MRAAGGEGKLRGGETVGGPKIGFSTVDGGDGGGKADRVQQGAGAAAAMFPVA